MDKSLIKELEQVIDVISLFQIRESKFREELDFFNHDWNENVDSIKVENLILPEDYSPEKIKKLHLLSALRRLDHEVMFLCIDVYSLYEGVQKQRSLYSRVMKNSGKSLRKVDQTEGSSDTLIDLGIFGSGGWQESSEKEKDEHLKIRNEERLESRKRLRDHTAPQSHQHAEMDQWIDSLLNPVIVSNLHDYRKKFAHRLDTLDNLKEEMRVNHPKDIQDRLDTVNNLLSIYKSFFQDIIGYMTSVYYEGIKGIDYPSLSQIQERRKFNLWKINNSGSP